MRVLSLAALVCTLAAAGPSAADLSEQILTASDASGSAYLFGGSLALSEDTLVVGAVLHDGMGQAAGAAYVFRAQRPPGGLVEWIEAVRLHASDAEVGDNFGASVAIDRDTLVVGASGEGDPGYFSGAAYVLERNAGGPEAWGEVRKLEASDAAQLDRFGVSVAISGDTIVVGAQFDEDAGPSSGSAYVFERDAGGPDNWGEVEKLVASDAIEGHHFGCCVAISGDTIVVGAYGDEHFGFFSGAAYVYERNAGGPGNWGEAKKLLAPDGVNFDQFGSALSIDGDEIAVGMFSDDDPFHKSGSGYVFERDLGGSDSWGLRKKIGASDAGERDWFGRAIAIRDGRVVSGALSANTAVLVSGSSYLFERDAGGASNWGEAAKLVSSDAEEGDHFGVAVAVDHASIVIGADTAEAVYVYRDPTDLPELTSWSQMLLVLALLGAGHRYFRIGPVA